MKNKITEVIAYLCALTALLGASSCGGKGLAVGKKILSPSEQIEYFAGHTEMWRNGCDEEYMSRPQNDLLYTVTDLDGNGRLEVITSIYAGTGRYSYTRVTEMNESFDGLTVCRNLVNEELQPDISQSGEMSVYHDVERDIYYYLCKDFRLDSLDDITVTKMAWFKQGDKMDCKILGYLHIAENGGYFNSKDEEISEEQFENAESIFEADGFDKYKVTFGWINEEIDFDDTDSITELLNQSYADYNKVLPEN